MGSYVTDRDVGDAPDEQMPSGTVGTGKACYLTWGVFVHGVLYCERYVIGETGRQLRGSLLLAIHLTCLLYTSPSPRD